MHRQLWASTLATAPTTAVAAPSRAVHAARAARAAPTESDFAALLRAFGVRAVLGALNARTRFRFTGLYRVQPPLLLAVCLYDRENPALHLAGGASALSDTYCAIVVGSARAFATADGPADPRLDGHAALAGPVRSYVGVPIRGADGRVSGTLCHYDHRPRLVPPDEAQVLDVATRALRDAVAAGVAAD
jgi:GAF domain-containing protein